MGEEKKEKDPAVLFYTADFLADTTLWSYEELGRYIKLLCIQHQQDGISEEDFLTVASGCKRVLDKFEAGSDGLYRNHRMSIESEKRKRYSESRRNNRRSKSKETKSYENHMNDICDTSVPHMGNENENINDNVIVTEISNKEIRECEREEEKRKIVEIIAYLNSKLNSRYTVTADYINKHIRARLSEGFTVEDFKTVIDKKHREWSGTEMAKFLRPETLFGTKFQQYLNQPDVPYVPKTAIGRCGVEHYVGEDATTDLDGIIGD